MTSWRDCASLSYYTKLSAGDTAGKSEGANDGGVGRITCPARRNWCTSAAHIPFRDSASSHIQVLANGCELNDEYKRCISS